VSGAGDGDAFPVPPEPPIPDPALSWQILGLAPTRDETEIRRAYVRRLKTIDADNDPASFIRLREARDLVLYVNWRTQAVPAGDGSDVLADDAEYAGPSPEAVANGQPRPAESDGRASDARVEEAAMPAAEPAGPGPEAPEQAAAEIEIDAELFGAIDRMLFGDAPYDADALRTAAETLFAHPALDRISMFESVQNWAVNVIVNASPRSDPMIEAAIARFGWAENLADWQRPAVFNWILERRYDAEFERDLIAADPVYADAIAALRTPGGPPPNKHPWGVADRVKAFLFYVRQYHPTSLSVCDRDAVTQWDAFLISPPFPYGTVSPLVTSWTGHDNIEQLLNPNRELTPQLVLGVIFLAPIFAWRLIRPGFATPIRIVALVWLATFCTGFYVAGSYLPDVPPSPGHANRAALTTPELDLNPIVSGITHGRLDMSGLQRSNPRLYGRLIEAWSSSKTGDIYGPSLNRQVVALMESFYRDALRAAPPAIQSEYWRVKLEELNWLRQWGGRYCDLVVRDQGYANSYRFPESMRDRALAVRVSIWRDVSADPPPRNERVSISGPVVEAAARRAHLDERAFAESMRGASTPENNCAAKIALAETALARPPAESARLIRDLTSLE